LEFFIRGQVIFTAVTQLIPIATNTQISFSTSNIDPGRFGSLQFPDEAEILSFVSLFMPVVEAWLHGADGTGLPQGFVACKTISCRNVSCHLVLSEISKFAHWYEQTTVRPPIVACFKGVSILVSL
jgi:hypothetical protein